MRHPIEQCNIDQAAMLAELPESQRENMARFFRIGNATYRYYQRANELAVFNKTVEPTSGDDPVDNLLAWLEAQINPAVETRSARELLNIYFEEFLAGLTHEGMRRTMEREGIDKAKRSFPFLRYLLERHDIGMDEYLRLNLSEADYAYHKQLAEPLNQ